MSRRLDRVVMESGRAWWERVSRHGDDPCVLDGYGQLASRGAELSRIIAADVRRKLALSEDTSLLEVGCGAGAITRELAGAHRRVVGADFSVGMLLHARRLNLPEVEFLAADATSLPFASGSFDRVLCYSVFNNFPSLDYAARAVEELVRVTRPGGMVLIGQVPNADRQQEWLRAYADRFGAGHRSAVRSWLGACRQRAVLALRGLLAAMGKAPPASLHLFHYHSSFFEELLKASPHQLEILPACDLLREGDEPGFYDYRLDFRIAVSPAGSGQKRTLR